MAGFVRDAGPRSALQTTLRYCLRSVYGGDNQQVVGSIPILGSKKCALQQTLGAHFFTPLYLLTEPSSPHHPLAAVLEVAAASVAAPSEPVLQLALVSAPLLERLFSDSQTSTDRTDPMLPLLLELFSSNSSFFPLGKMFVYYT